MPETRPPLEGLVAVEALNGGSRKGKDARVADLVRRRGCRTFRRSRG